jgi:hypothetical protein
LRFLSLSSAVDAVELAGIQRRQLQRENREFLAVYRRGIRRKLTGFSAATVTVTSVGIIATCGLFAVTNDIHTPQTLAAWVITPAALVLVLATAGNVYELASALLGAPSVFVV